MKFTILGAGNTGKAYSAFLSHGGHQVLLYDRSQERLAPIQAWGSPPPAWWRGASCPGDHTAGGLRGQRRDPGVHGGGGTPPAGGGAGGVLRPGQIILVTNCCWGAVEFDMELGAEAERKGCPSGDGGTADPVQLPAPDCGLSEDRQKEHGTGMRQAGGYRRGAGAARPVFPQLCPAANVLETSPNNSNPHLPRAAGPVQHHPDGEREDFLLFGTGVTPRVARFMEKIDRERVAVVRACGVSAPQSWRCSIPSGRSPRRACTMCCTTRRPIPSPRAPGPWTTGILRRTCPMAWCPMCLGRKLGVETPVPGGADRDVPGLYMDQDYFQQGPEVEQLDLSRYRKTSGGRTDVRPRCSLSKTPPT